jgi:hypothetical protein
MASCNEDKEKKELQLRRNIQKNEAVTACIELINNVLDEYPFTTEEQSEVIRRVSEEFIGKPPKVNFTPMAYDEARSFYHSHIMGFGKWKNTKLEEVDFDYLIWLDDQPDFRRDLTRFMASEFVRNAHYLGSK